ncbi:UNKNOWN [Stylonychia lemnae]|uniref:Uncharacterized protein n=1 Tax=Stylonychia lemnae TaxID=5949 RepID=A0A078ASX8_STYLE|nr:UNKNOWN [Stylonychia lemnae]|eukprot:CDW85126.1 UNKNOWN [Stylonychia lemnae]
MPSTDFIMIEKPNNDEKLPIFEAPLAKCNHDDKTVDDDILIGFKSGKRSAILKLQESNNFFRLKGCGNMNLGFNKQQMAFPEEWQEIRGVQFSNTAFREIYFSEKINNLLNQKGFVLGNTPYGLWKYSEDIDNLTNDCPKLDKYCGIYKTFGDKRLATHLFQGIEIILKSLINIGIQQGDISIDHLDKLKNLFNQSRINTQNNSISKTSTLTKFKDPSISNPKIQEDLSEYCQHSESVKQTLKERLQNFSSILGFLEAVILMFKRAGYETGQVKRTLDENLISWGYYIDHNPFQPHCNAHPNNFLVLDLLADYNNEYHNLLAPVDFDMTYEFKQFISNVQDDPAQYGKQDRELFDSWSGSEKYELEKALGGEENMANFVYGIQEEENQAEEQKEDDLSQQIFKTLNVCLRDVSVLNYRESYDKINHQDWIEDKYSYQTRIQDINQIIQLALLLTDNKDT